MKRLGRLNYELVRSGVHTLGSYDPNEVFNYFGERLQMNQSQEIWDFLEWVHKNNKPFGDGNYEQVFAEFKASK